LSLAYERIFAELNKAKVRYLVVGGVAVGFHGYPRLTADLDLMIDLDPDQVARALQVLIRLGLRPHIPEDPMRFADRVIRRGWIREKGMLCFPWWHPSDSFFRLDVFVRHPIRFKPAYAKRKIMKAGALLVPAVCLKDLLRMKRLAGRPKDLEDIRMLRKCDAS